jgi:hypothetical protein
MKSSELIVLLSALFSPISIEAQEISRVTRFLEEQQAISHISQAEYYARMALRSLETSEKIGRAPYFNYQTAREDIEKVLSEFNTYLKGDESTDFPTAMPLIVDGRYFAESIQDFLATHKTEGQVTNSLPTKSPESRSVASKTPTNTSASMLKKGVADKEPKVIQQNSAPVLLSPGVVPQSSKTKRDKIEEILRKGL